MKLGWVLLAATVVILGLVPIGATGGSVDDDPAETLAACGDRVPHPPIYVQGNEGLLGYAIEDPATGEPRARPGSGVVAGTGTAEDPYVISGWCFTTSTTLVHPFPAAVNLYATDAHVVVEDNVIAGATGEEVGVFVNGAENVLVRDNEIAGVETGVKLGHQGFRSQGNTVEGNAISSFLFGVAVSNGPGTIVADNDIDVNDRVGIYLSSDSPDVRVEDNTIRNEPPDEPDPRTSDRESLGIYGLPHSYRVQGNLIEGMDVGVLLAWGTMEDNTVKGNGVGVEFGGSATIRSNLVADNDEAGLVSLAKADDAEIANNDIEANGVGLSLEGEGYTLEARGNWWGHPSGPAGGVEDACTDAVADGEGQALLTEGPSICFDPWLEQPLADAGASS